jgi:hypothetical protein
MFPNQILGIPIIEEAAPANFVAAEEVELHSQVQHAVELLRCRWCGSLNYATTLFVFEASVEKMIECRHCGNVATERLYEDLDGPLAFLSRYELAW